MQGAGFGSGASFAAGGLPCADCGTSLPPRALVCPACGTLVFRERLQQLANEAARQEWTDPARAVAVWRQCLGLLPPDSEQYQHIAERAEALAQGAVPIPGSIPVEPGVPSVLPYADPSTPRTPPSETWLTVLLKTGGSMAVNLLIYKQILGGWWVAVGLLCMLLIHELGHSLANWYFGIPQSPPIFVPFLGALIILKRNPKDARVESVIGIAGPVTGTLGVLIAYAWYLKTGSVVAADLAKWGTFLNLFNLIPCPPMDGGRVSAAISPALWAPGVLGFVAFLGSVWWQEYRQGGGFNWMLLLVVFWILRGAVPRVLLTLRSKWWRNPYYQVGSATRIAMTASCLGLAGLLIYLQFTINQLLGVSGLL